MMTTMIVATAGVLRAKRKPNTSTNLKIFPGMSKPERQNDR